MNKVSISGMLLAGLIFGISPDVFAVQDSDPSQWGNKLGRGVVNVVTSPLEIPRTVNIKSDVEGPAKGWTVGLVHGVARGVLRLGTGAVEVVTFPFDFPNEGYPMMNPTYSWQGWDDGAV